MNISEQQNQAEPSDAIRNDNQMAESSTHNTQYAIKGPGPPFHMSDINSLDLHIQATSYMASQVPPQGSQPTIGPRDLMPGGVSVQDGNEMDLSGGERSVDYGSPATISSQSRGGSTSQSSYSPGRRNEIHIPYRASPKTPFATLSSGGATVLPKSVSFEAINFDSTSSMGDAGFNENLVMSNEWDYAALNTETGLPAMTDASWDAMLESVTMGWDSGNQMQGGQADMFGAG